MPTDISLGAHQHADIAGGRASAPAVRRGRSRTGLKLAGILATCLALAVVILGLLDRAHQSQQLKRWTAAQAIPTVDIIKPQAEAGSSQLILPGNLQADYNAAIYSRVSGYVHAWYVDIGAKVHAGELLATIDTPELDQQLAQAEADLESAKANMALAGTTAKRWKTLLAQDAVSKQETEEKAGDFAVKTAMVNAAKANLDRLAALKSFSRIVAPFDGVVTQRRTDIGALVNAGAGASANSELFDVAKVNRLRLYVSVPQSYSARFTQGMTAALTVPEYPGRAFKATLTSTANAVSDRTGTLLVELAVDNADGALKSGDYAEVKFDLASAGETGTLRLPASALLFRNEGMEAALVGPDSHVHLQPVTIGVDLGPTVEISSGLKTTDRIIDNPPDSISNGDLVRVAQGADEPKESKSAGS